MKKITLEVNKKTYNIEIEPDTPLIFVLRNYLKLKGTKLGCSLEQCGTCLVLSEGDTLYSCTTPVSELEGKSITTIEGIGNLEKMDKIQTAFVNQRAAQCGYCLPGIIVSTKNLLNKNSDPSEIEIKEALSLNLCRCGSHNSIIKAVLEAAREIKK